ncbi:uroplakin-2 [Rhinoraja longicauda]
MRLLFFLALASICWAQDFMISLVNETETQVIANRRSMSAIISLPPCNFSSMTVKVTVTNSTGQGPTQPNFEMPVCRIRRDLVSLMSAPDGISQTNNVGYQVTMLKQNMVYNVSYSIGSKRSNQLQFMTISPVDYMSIDTSFGRSGAMVVITVLLVIAMVALIITFIVVLVLYK